MIKEILKMYPDELTPLAESRKAYITTMACPRCKVPMSPAVDHQHPFTPDDPLPRQNAKCDECGYTVDPRTGIVLEVGQIMVKPERR